MLPIPNYPSALNTPPPPPPLSWYGRMVNADFGIGNRASSAFTWVHGMTSSRRFRLAAAHSAWTGAFYLGFDLAAKADASGARATYSLAAVALHMLGTAIHPGSLGDSQVPDSAQRSLLSTMRLELTGHAGDPDARSWVMARSVGNFAMSAASLIILDPRPLMGTMSSGYAMIPYLYDRSWSAARTYRADPQVAMRSVEGLAQYLRAWAQNIVNGCVLDGVACAIVMHIDYSVWSPIFPDRAAPTLHDFGTAMVPIIGGTLINHITIGILAKTPFADSRAARFLGHGLRLATRFGLRATMRGASNFVDQMYGTSTWLTLAQDTSNSGTMHRWGQTSAADYSKLVYMNPAHAEQRFPRAAAPGGSSTPQRTVAPPEAAVPAGFGTRPLPAEAKYPDLDPGARWHHSVSSLLPEGKHADAGAPVRWHNPPATPPAPVGMGSLEIIVVGEPVVSRAAAAGSLIASPTALPDSSGSDSSQSPRG